MLQTYWLALAAGAFIMTLAWLFVERNTFVTSVLAGALWAYAAYTGGSLDTITESGSTVSAAAPELQYPALALSLLSFFGAVAYWTGHYPPTRDTVAEAEREAT
jgi:hypothetical protein